MDLISCCKSCNYAIHPNEAGKYKSTDNVEYKNRVCKIRKMTWQNSATNAMKRHKDKCDIYKIDGNVMCIYRRTRNVSTKCGFYVRMELIEILGMRS